MKILLVDDDVFLRDMYAMKFTAAGDEVNTAASASEALEELKNDTYDVLITDMVMPGMTGLELIKAVREDASITCKCIVLSNQSEQTDRAAAEALNVDGYIVKAEMIPSDVVTAVKKAVGT